jgi:hypothetical protein
VVILLAAALLLGPVDVLEGSIVDPQGRVVAGVQITLACEKSTTTTTSDASGRFAFAKPDNPETCRLTASHAGFATVTLSTPRSSELWVIELPVAPVRTSIDVFDSFTRARAAPSLSSSSISGVELERLSSNALDLIEFAKAVAGTNLKSDAIYVDGLLSSSLPPAEAIHSVSVNVDPFSAEYAEADRNHIEILTKQPAERLRFNMGGSPLGRSTRKAAASSSNSLNFGASGPLPGPLSFLLQGSLHRSATQELTGITKNSTRSAMVSMHYVPSEYTHAAATVQESFSNDQNAGLWGLTRPEAAVSASLRTREGRVTWHRAFDSVLYRSAFRLTQQQSENVANSRALGISVVGDFSAGGNAIAESRARRTSWTWKNVAHFAVGEHVWTAGIEASQFRAQNLQAPNPEGILQYPTLDSYTSGAGRHLRQFGNGLALRSTFVAAPFLETDLVQSENFILRGGLRVEYQSQEGVLASPRLFAQYQIGRLTWRGGAGLFVENLSNDILVRIDQADREHLRHVVTRPDGQAVSIHSSTDPRLTRARKLLIKTSAEFRHGVLAYTAEYSRISSRHLLGSHRVMSDAEWTDVLASDRKAARHQVHGAVQYTKNGHGLTFHYEWIHAHDDSEGPFSFPARAGDLKGEWAKSAGIAAHNAGLTGHFALPQSVSLSILGRWHGAAPFNVVTSADPYGNFLYNDRDGRIRNSAMGPAYSSLSLYLHRRLPLVKLFPEAKLYGNLRIQVENVLDSRNYLSFGSVLGSAMFGKPLASRPGRTITVSLSFDL